MIYLTLPRVLPGAESLNNLAILLRAQGDPAAARPLHERALAIYEKVLGPDHPATATSLNNLTAALQAQGDIAAAQPLYEHALAIREKALGPDHPDTLSSAAAPLANCVDRLGTAPGLTPAEDSRRGDP